MQELVLLQERESILTPRSTHHITTDLTLPTFSCAVKGKWLILIVRILFSSMSILAGDTVTVEMHQQPGDRSCSTEAIGMTSPPALSTVPNSAVDKRWQPRRSCHCLHVSLGL